MCDMETHTYLTKQLQVKSDCDSYVIVHHFPLKTLSPVLKNHKVMITRIRTFKKIIEDTGERSKKKLDKFVNFRIEIRTN